MPVLLAVAVLVTASAIPSSARGQDAPEPLRLLDVPYLPQSEALCGGAAAAMLMRFWGAVNVYADAFAHLVDPAAGGIRGDDLMQALSERGWQARSFRGDAPFVQRHLASRRPVIALVEDRPGRFHYVVVVGWSGGRVIAHDPARAPYRVYNETAFLTAWSQSDFWTLLVLPEAGGNDAAAREAAPAAERPGEEGCASMVSEGIRLAGGGEMDGARRLLELSAEACPRDSAPWRELAGLHALRREWTPAAATAREALVRNAHDAHAARILATSLFVSGDAGGALAAWNRLDEPRIDLVNVRGLERMRYDIVARALGLEPRTLLTPSSLEAARRRLSELPGAIASRVFYTPVEGGRANVDAVVLERPFVPSGILPLTALALRGVTDRELSVAVANPTGGGEVVAGSWRWWNQRPAVSLSLSTPSPVHRLGTVWRIEAFGERQTYDFAGHRQERRRGASLAVADWASSSLRWEVSLGFDRWPSRGAALAAGGAIERRGASDRMSARAQGSVWRGEVSTAVASLQAGWRSETSHEGAVWLARAGIDLASTSAPLALWPGAGSGHGRDALLRAHPLLAGGVVRNGVFGRSLAHGGAEWRRWTRAGRSPVRIAPAAFLDLARAARGEPGFDGRTHVDAGVGLRLAFPATGVLRVDVGRGLRDGEMALSFGWTR